MLQALVKDEHAPKYEAQRESLLFLHCSTGSGKCWAEYTQTFDQAFSVSSPDLYGYGESKPWHGQKPITLQDEADAIIHLIDCQPNEVHLIGHSFGGAVALNVAQGKPKKLASLTLIEPVAFNLLNEDDQDDQNLYQQIEDLSDYIASAVMRGDYWNGMKRFIDYWGGNGSWEKLEAPQKLHLANSIQRVPLDFWATMHNENKVADLQLVDLPTLILCGTKSPAPVKRISRLLNEEIEQAYHRTISDAGHMLPMTHKANVIEHLNRHFESSTANP